MTVLRYSPVTAPAGEPVSLADVKLQCRIDDGDTSQDALITLLIASARRYAEQLTGRSFITQAWLATADRFPGCPGLLVGGGAYASAQPIPAEPPDLFLQHGPLLTIDWVKYLDAAGVLQTLDPATYVVDTGRLAPAAGCAWPATLGQLGAVRIQFQAGYGPDADDVPAHVRHWLLVRVATAFENRMESEVVAKGRIEAMPYVDALLEVEKVWSV